MISKKWIGIGLGVVVVGALIAVNVVRQNRTCLEAHIGSCIKCPHKSISS